MSRALPIVLSAVLVGGIAGAALLPGSTASTAASGQVSAQAESAVTPIVPTDWKTAGLAVGSAYSKQQAAAKAAAAKAAAAKAAKAAADARARRARDAARASRSRRTVPVYSGDPRSIAQSMLAARGWSGQFSCLDSLWSKESGWNTYAANSSGAYGIPQALPGSKMASAGSDWRTNPATQIQWGLNYIAASYGTPCGAWSHSQSYNWY